MSTPPSFGSPTPPPFSGPGKIPPTDPTNPGSGVSPQDSSAVPAKPSFEDPAGIWQAFLSKGGTTATPQDVQTFLNTLLKFFSSVILKQSDDAAKRAAQKFKRSIEGDGD